ncbi:hypothetical protein BIV60_04750 [Bacillus sp. MUM 116]|uniref:DHHW family protein n=1 Tax=Bacillus sp. MUM 116 TaxID=1678002 RepID=UPI0008F5DE28|nr:DHHW family protein [Bacillus sp. MUM 116]OIK16328.1 hypothetical protein BIV60_04750 [Bacillus sp. MUM 116]
MKKTNVQGVILISVFLLTIFGFFFTKLVTPSKAQSVIENRKLTQRPDLTAKNILVGDYSKRFEQYYNDQFPMRDSFIEANAAINKDVLNQNVVKDVFVANDGYLLSQVPEVTPENAKKIAGHINDFVSNMAKRNVTVFTALMPNKSTMMEKEFPSYFPSYGQKDMDLIYKNLNKLDHPIDTRNTLKKHMNEKYMFFYTDHHWNAKAAFYAYQNVMNDIIKTEKSQDHVYKYNDYSWNLEGKPFYGSDARKTTSANAEKDDQILVAQLRGQNKPLIVKSETRKLSGLYNQNYLNFPDKYTNRYMAFLGGDYPETTIYNPNMPKGKNILVIKDSYANAFVQFIVPHYKETHILDLRHYKKMSVEQYVVKNKIDQVILLNNINSLVVTPALTNFNHPGQGENQ